MSIIHFIGGEKGGVGKSLVARLFAQYMIDREIPFLGFDTDGSHGTLTRFYREYASPVIADRYESLDAVVESAAADPHRRILVDLAAQTHRPLVRWMRDSGVLDLAEEMGLSIRYWHVMDSGRDSVDLLAKLFDQFGRRLDYVIVQNAVRGEDFGILESSGQKERALSLRAQTVSVGKLHDTAITRIDANNVSFWAAANNPDREVTGLGLLDRQRVRVWLKKAFEEFDRIGV